MALSLAGVLVLSSHVAFAQQPPPADPGPPPEPAAPPPAPGYAPPPAVQPYPGPYAAPIPGPPPAPAYKRRSTGMFIAGIIMSAVGAADAIAGVVEFVAADDICGLATTNSKSSLLSTRNTCIDTYKIVGVTGMVVGGVLVAVGLPMAIVGGAKVPAQSGQAPAGRLSLRVGPTSAGVGYAF